MRSMAGLKVRQAAIDDAPALVALVNSAFRGESSRAGWTTEDHLVGGQRIDVERLSETLSQPDVAILVYEEAGVPVASLLLERTGEDCYLGMMTVRPTAQGQGLGRQMLETAERWAVAHWSSKSMHMTVIAQRSELIAWYERRGYRRTGERKPFPYGDERCGLPKRDDLEFEVLSKSL
jgi:ribosomal protein S18 acetylase RimI-like enzyme